MRIPLSKRTRFEVFKRDGLRCTYCGQRPPDVVLVVDHIVPVVDGGDNELDNLTTACDECNAGKSAVPLGSVAPAFDETSVLLAMQEMAERRAVMDQFHAERRAGRADVDDAVARARHLWRELLARCPDWGGEYDPFQRQSIVNFLNRGLCEHHFVQAIQEVGESWRSAACGRTRDSLWRHFCKICWETVRAGGSL